MKDMDVKMTALIEDTSRWILPDLAPNGTYSASPVCEGGSGHGGSRLTGRVSVQGVKSLGSHFACFEFYEVKKKFVFIFQ